LGGLALVGVLLRAARQAVTGSGGSGNGSRSARSPPAECSYVPRAAWARAQPPAVSPGLRSIASWRAPASWSAIDRQSGPAVGTVELIPFMTSRGRGAGSGGPQDLSA